MSPVAVWQVVCIVSVVSVQFLVESGCIAIKQSLSLNAAILSGPKNLSFAVSSTGRLQRLGWKLRVLPAVLPVLLPCLWSSVDQFVAAGRKCHRLVVIPMH